MAEELRYIYNEEFVAKLGNAFLMVYPPFETEKFHELVIQLDWNELALKERMRRITVSMHETLPNDYTEALKILYKVAPQFTGLAGIIFPDYVDQYGLEYWDVSMEALAFLTPYSTSEFAVRPFLLKNQDRMLKQMLEWSKDSNEHIRRLASEGSRPRLPWGQSVPSLKKNPEVTLPILTNLREDDSLYVRKSVANHLNDISYIHPELVLNLASEWLAKNKQTDWIIKHACRSLLKKGNPRTLALFGFKDDEAIELGHFSLDKKVVSIDDSIQFYFTLFSNKTMPVRVEYSIDYVKANGKRSKKVFMISSFEIKENEKRTFVKKQSFKDLTTRKHYRGIHTISVIINGSVKDSLDFEVI
ncbi:DNA alkylation repair protein [Pseudoneobacillus sp. C159]